MATSIDIDLRASRAPAWLKCPARASYLTLVQDKTKRDPKEPVPIALAFGNAVHAAVTGADDPEPKHIVYDEHTRSSIEYTRQSCEAIEVAVAQIANGPLGSITWREEHLETLVEVLGATIRVTGHIDLVCEVEDGQVDIVDLKTGRMDQRSALSQMAIYAWLAAKHDWNIRDVVILHVPRGVKAKHEWRQVHNIIRRPAGPLIDEAWDMIRLVALSVRHPVANPDTHCGRCENVQCVYHPEQDYGESNE